MLSLNRSRDRETWQHKHTWALCELNILNAHTQRQRASERTADSSTAKQSKANIMNDPNVANSEWNKNKNEKKRQYSHSH